MVASLMLLSIGVTESGLFAPHFYFSGCLQGWMRKKRTNKFLSIEGRNPVLEALRADVPVEQILIYAQARSDEKINKIVKLAGSKKIKTRRVDKRTLKRCSRTGIYQGVIALAPPPQPLSLTYLLNQLDEQKQDPFLLILANVFSEQNLGAVIRTAESVGVHALILSNRSFGLTPLVVRASMGACFWIPIIQTNLFSALKLLTDQGIVIIGAETSGDEDYWAIDLSGPLALVVGGEDQGITLPLKKYCQKSIRIPMFGRISSLNLSVATAVILFERARQLAKTTNVRYEV
jgi:23S rRNA (guanosine2251-2'-O)-methyltransferase